MKIFFSHKIPFISPRLSRLSLALALAFASLAQAAPVGGVVGVGGATISTSGSTTNVLQSTPKASINWQSFSVAPSETVRFIQPSSSAIMLNRVLGPDASSIMGTISANGRVFLINPNGIAFGKGSQVNVGGLVASTLGLSDTNFLAGNYQFNGASTAAITNLGNINGDGGYIALLGANVSNNGLISAQLGTVALAGGNAITLDLAGDHLLKVTIDQGALNAMVSNGNLIIADGGQVIMTAQGAGTLLSNSVNNTGVIQAQSIDNINGAIVLSSGSQAGATNVGGLLDASGVRAGQTGGSVQVLGNTVNLTNANINASGNAGGGLVLVGGNFKGAGPQANSLSTNMDNQSAINADSIQTGNGGRIAIWSDGTTAVAGTLSARGGALSGNGGYIETSGQHLLLASTVSVNTLAQHGVSGMWLLDPTDFTIAPTGGDISGATLSTELGLTSVEILSSQGGSGSSGNIYVKDAIAWSSANSLTLTAVNAIEMNSAGTITPSGSGGLALNAGTYIKMYSGSSITPSGSGLFSMTAGTNVNIDPGASITYSTANSIIDITARGGNISNGGAITASGGGNTINLNASGSIASPGTITTSGSTANSLHLTAGGNIDGTGGTVTVGGVTYLYAGTAGPGSVTMGTLTTPDAIVRFSPTSYDPSLVTADIAAYSLSIPSASSIKAWALLGANKVYDSTRAATLSIVGAPAGLSLSSSGGSTATFGDKNVGTGKTVTYTGYSLTGNTAQYELFPGNISGATTTTANITAAPLTVSATGTNKVYNATTTDAVTLSSNAFAGDTVALSNTAANFIDKNVGNAKTVNVTGISITGAEAANYTANSTTTTTANITAAPLTVSATGTNKAYDGNTTDAVTLRSNAFTGDVVTLNNTAANFETSSIGVNKTVNVTGITTSGADAGNYTANTSTTTTASITSGIPVVDSGSGSGAPYVVPVTPTETNSQKPIALKEDVQGGTSTPLIVPVVALGSPSESGSTSSTNGNSNAGMIGVPLLAGAAVTNKPQLLTVVQSPRDPEMQSLFPAVAIPLVAPIRLPKQGRN